MKVSIIITAILLLFVAFSTIFHDTTLVGYIGHFIGDTNIYLFGYIAYLNPILFFYPLYLFYKKPWLIRRFDIHIGWVLFIISIVLLQALVIDSDNTGFIGKTVYAILLPFIGKAGVWFFWMMIFLLATALIIDDKYEFDGIKNKIKTFFSKTKPIQKIKIGTEYTNNDDKIHSLKSIYSTIISKFQNPFNFYRKREIEDILHMPLTDIEHGYNSTDEIPEDSTITPVYNKPIDDYLKPSIQKQLVVNKDHTYNTDALDTTTTISKPEITTKSQKESSPKSSIKIVNELAENSKILSQIEKGDIAQPINFKLPKIDFLQKAPKVTKRVNETEIDKKSGDLLEKLKMFKIHGDIVRTYTGPLVTTFEFKPAPDIKVSKILGLQDDLAMALSAETIRIQAPIPGRNVVGIEIPNEGRNTIYLREILDSKLFKESSSPLTVALGKDIVGNPFITDIKKLPHLLIAGTTGSGKSVGINAMLISLLYRNDPDQLKLMMIDPKMLEFSIYNDIPHLITPVITEPKKAIIALANMVAEMERRYKLLAEKRTKNIDNYNDKVKKDGSMDEVMPFIVIIIDELADLMMNGGKEVETSIARLAQKSRACGIHLIVATQRPSVDVVTGIIKANLPSRLSYRVSQRIDSKVILDSMGAESLLGQGDGLFTPPGTVGLVRIHAPWIQEEEIEKIVEFLKLQRVPEYDESYLIAGGGVSGRTNELEIDLDELYEQAKEVVLTDKKTSISYLQRKLQIGYNRSANIIDQLSKMGVLSEPNAKGQRDIL